MSPKGERAEKAMILEKEAGVDLGEDSHVGALLDSSECFCMVGQRGKLHNHF